MSSKRRQICSLLLGNAIIKFSLAHVKQIILSIFPYMLHFKLTSKICRLYYLPNLNNVPIESKSMKFVLYEGWNFNSGNYLFTTDTK